MSESEQEINERLARFIWPDAKSVTVTENEMFVVFPRYKEPMGYRGLPFTESLDAQVKYLWPRLTNMGLSIRIVGDLVQPDNWLVSIGNEQYVSAPTPALACAEAVGKLLDAMEGK